MFDTVSATQQFQFSYQTAYTWQNSSAQSEANLIARAQHGDLAAFNDLILTYQDQVYRQAYWILGEQEAAEDAAQEAFLRAYRKINTYNGSSFRAWVLRITTNYCIDQIRAQKSHPIFALDVYNQEDDEEMDSGSWLRDPSASPEQVVERAEVSSAVNGCLMKMDPKYRTAIILVDIQEMDYQEAASIMGMRLGSFKSRLARARAQLSQALNSKYSRIDL